MKIAANEMFAVLSASVVIIVVAAALLVIGSPQHIRLRRLDEERAADLTRLSIAISNYRTNYGAFPEPLEEVHRFTMLPRVATADPTGRPYEFRALDPRRYELCTTFDTTDDGKSSPPSVGVVFQKHSAGRQCFELEVKTLQK